MMGMQDGDTKTLAAFAYGTVEQTQHFTTSTHGLSRVQDRKT